MAFDITSCGGSCSAGIAICNMIRKASAEGHASTSHVIGLAASMASVIACACDRMTIDDNAFLMVHLPWTAVEGNANDLRREADNLDKFKSALISVYRTKFDLPDEQISQLLSEETWILGSQAVGYGIKCEVLDSGREYKVAASIRGMKFAKIPESILNRIDDMKNEETKEEEKTVEETVEAKQAEETQVEQPEKEEDKPVEEKPDETKEPEGDCGEEKKEDEPEMIAKAECEKRVSGMQSKMAKQLDAVKKEYDGKIEDFKNQLKAKDEELSKANAALTSLNAKLEDVSNELQKTASALEMKTDALAKLNASVNTPHESVNWRELKGKQFFDYLKAHPEVTKENK